MALRDLDIDVDIDVDENGLSEANRKVDELVRSLERLDRDYRIKVDVDLGSALMQVQALDQQLDALRNQNIDIEVDTLGAKTEVAALNAELNALRDHRINIDVDTDTMDVLDDIIALEAILKDLERERIKIHFDANLESALADLAALETMAEALSRERYDIELDVDISRALTKVTMLEERIRALDNITINIDVDIGAAATQLAALQNQMTMLRMRRHINIDMDVAAAMAQVAALQAQLAALQAQAGSLNLGGGGGGLGGLLGGVPGAGIGLTAIKVLGVTTAITLALPAVAAVANVAIGAVGALAVAIGTLGGAALALGSALALGGAGLMGFSSIAISSIAALYEEKAKLTASQKELKAETDKVADSWNNLKKALEPTLFDATKNGVKAINTLLNAGEPILKKVGSATSDLMGNLNKSLHGNEMQAFFGMLKRDIGPITSNLGNGLGNALKGVANTMTAFAPLTRWASQGFENMMGRFSNWTAGLIGSNGMNTFMEYVKENAPKLGSALGNATLGVTKFFAAFAGKNLASDSFTWFQNKMSQFNDWAGNLGNNAGFQNFLGSIKDSAPIVGSIFKNLGSSIKGLWGAFTDSSSGNSALQTISNMFERVASFANNPNIQKAFSGALSFDFSKMFSGIGGFLDSGAGVNAFVQSFDGVGKLIGEGLKTTIQTALRSFNLGDVFAELDIGGKLESSLLNSNMPSTFKSVIEKMNIGQLINEAFGATDVHGGVAQNIAQNVMTQTQAAMSGIGNTMKQNATSQMTSLFTATNGQKIEIPVEANTANFASSLQNASTGMKANVPVEADTGALSASLTNLPPANVPMKADTSILTSSLTNLPTANVPVKADTSTVTNSLANLPAANVPVKADTSTVTSSLASLPSATVPIKADTSTVTNSLANLPAANMPVNPVLQQTASFFSAPTTVNVKPVVTEQPKIEPVTVQAKLQVDKSALGGLTSGMKINFGPMPKFSWPALPKFTWPPLPKWSWPPMPKFNWPPYPRFSWPPMPKFSWPPMPTVKVSVSGAGAHGSHASGLGKVPFDNYVGNLHKDEAIIPASDANNLRASGVLSGDGSNPTVNPLAASTAVPTPVAATSRGGGAVTVKIDAPITVQGGNTNAETAQNLQDALQQFWNDKYEQFAGIFDGELEF